MSRVDFWRRPSATIPSQKRDRTVNKSWERSLRLIIVDIVSVTSSCRLFDFPDLSRGVVRILLLLYLLSHALGCGEYPLGVDKGARADVPFNVQVHAVGEHLIGKLQPLRILAPHQRVLDKDIRIR